MKWQHIAFLAAFTFVVTFAVNTLLPSVGLAFKLAAAAIAGGIGGWLSLKIWKSDT